MKILKLTAENVKRLKAVEITPDQNLVRITGKNAQGKTSVLDAIFWALGGQKNIQERPIRDGEEKARVTLDLGDMVVERRWTQKTTVLEVKNKDGAKYPTPQSILDALVGRLTFDPLAFMRMDARTQFDVLKDMVDAPEDLQELDRKRQDTFDLRTETNREVKSEKARLAAMGDPKDVGPKQDASALVKEIQAAMATNRANENQRSQAEDLALDAAMAEQDVVRIKKELEQAEERARETRAKATQAMEETAVLQDVDVSGLEERLDNLEEHNREAQKFQEFKDTQLHIEGLMAKADKYTSMIEDIDQAKRTAMEKTEFPVDGLAFGDGVVLYQGRPLDQASSAEQLRVSMGMAMAANPDLRVVRITDGSLLDSESFRVLEDMATDKDFQVWVEQVDETGQVGIVIEDGEVVAVNEKAVG